MDLITPPYVKRNERQRETLIDDCQATTGWSVVSGAATLSADPSIVMVGANSIKMLLPAGGDATMKKAFSFNLHGKSLFIALKCSSATDLTAVDIIIFNGVSYQTWENVPTNDMKDITATQYLSLHPSALSGAAIDLTNITAIGVRAAAAPATTPFINICDIRTIENIPATVMITVWDGQPSDWAEFYTRMAAKGWKGTLLIMSSRLNVLATSQWQKMSRAGFDIGSHGVDATVLEALTVHRVRMVAHRSQNEIQRVISSTRGCRIFGFAENGYTNEHLQEIKKWYKQVMVKGRSANAPSPKAQGLMINDWGTKTLEQKTAQIASIREHGGLLCPGYHEIGGGGISAADFQADLDMLEANGIVPLSFSQYDDLYGDSPSEPVYVPTFIEHISGRSTQPIPTNAGWNSSQKAGSGAYSPGPFYQVVSTGLTPNSYQVADIQAMLSLGNLGSISAVQWDRYTEIPFVIARNGVDAQCIARYQFKSVITKGELAAWGIGINIAGDMSLSFSSYGTSLATIDLATTLADLETAKILIRHYPGYKIDIYVNDLLKGSQTTLSKIPSGVGTSLKVVQSIENGAGGGVNCIAYWGQIWPDQEY